MDRSWTENGPMKSWRVVSILCLLMTVGVGSSWGETITLTASALGLSTSYDDGEEKTSTISNVNFSCVYLLKTNSNIQARASSGHLWNTSLIPGKISQVVINQTGNTNKSNIFFGTSSDPTTDSQEFSTNGTNTKTPTSNSNNCYGYFKITRNKNAVTWTSIVVTYTPATITLSKSSITSLDYNLGSGPSAAQTFTVSGSNIPANLTVTAPTNFEVSLNGSSWASSQTISVTLTGSVSAGTLSSTTVYVRLASGKSAGDYNGNVSIAMAGCNTISGVNPKTVAVSGTVTAASCSADVAIGTASLNGTFS